MDITKKEAAQFLSNANDDKRFFCNDGHVLSNLVELGDHLQDMNAKIFSFHVTDANNDLSNWVRDVIGDNELAEKLLAAKTQEDAARIVSERIKLLKKKSA